MKNYLKANWTAPSCVSALSTTRGQGVSLTPFDANNLAAHVGDEISHVLLNRQALKEDLRLLNDPVWLNQTHSTTCINVDTSASRDGDAMITKTPHLPLAIMTADCLPIVLTNTSGTEIAAIHAGWRGLCHGIIENTIKQMTSPPTTLMAWIGPAICKQCFEVGDEVREAFISKDDGFGAYFQPHHDKWRASLQDMAAMTLQKQGLNAIFQSNACTFMQDDEFYSYRKTNTTGRFATLIWISEPIG